MSIGTRRYVPFRCPTCGKPAVRVIETREWQGAIRRKRRCTGDPRHIVETRETLATTESVHI